MRLHALLLMSIGLLAVGLPTAVASAQQPDRPNVLVILADDLGRMDVTPFNPDTFYETPNVQRLAETGMQFNDAYVANPVCSPTRFSLMTGKYPSRHNATDWFCGQRVERFRHAKYNCEMPVDEVTMGEAFQEGGYAKFFAGKWHLGPEPRHWPKNQGFDINKGGWKAGAPYYQDGTGYFSPYKNPRLEDGPKGEYLPYRLADETSRFIENHQDEPFFAYLSFYEVHNPKAAPQKLVEKYRAKRDRLGLDDADTFEQIEQVWPDAGPRKARVVQSHPVYAAMVEALDRSIGQVLDTLEKTGEADNTIVVFISDHGGLSTSEGHNTSNRPLRGGKGWIYEGGLLTPLIVRWPGVTDPGSETDQPVMSNDLYPTLLEAAGLSKRPQQHKDAMAFTPILKGADAIDRGPLYWHYPHYSNQGGPPAGAIRMGPWKLVERYEDGSVELYNVERDIDESDDVAEQRPGQVKRMRKKLHQWYQKVDARFLRAKKTGPEPWRPGFMR
jgi:arylsulfatase A-like enzyme